MNPPVNRHSPNGIIVCLAVAFSLLAINASAQQCNDVAISEAMENFSVGKFDRVRELLTPCLNHFGNNESEFLARRLLAKVSLANDDFDQTGFYIKEMLVYKPDYQPGRWEENLTFIERVEAARDAMRREASADVLVTTASRYAQLLSSAPATIYVCTREQITHRGYRNLIDLLEDIPEVEIQRNSISEFKNQITFRGIAGIEKFMIMLDGVRITPSTGDPYTLGTNYSLVNAKSVEVIIGPASALYGADAFSGLINIITMEQKTGSSVQVNSSYGRYGTTDNSLVAGVHAGDVDITVAGQYYHSAEADLYRRYKNEYRWYTDKYLPDGLVDVNGSEVPLSVTASARQFSMPASSGFFSAKINFGDFEIGGLRNMERHSSSVSVDPRYTLYTREAFVSTTLQSVYVKHRYTTKRSALQSTITSNGYGMSPDTKFINRYTNYGKGYKYQNSQSKKIEEQWEYSFTKKTLLIAGASVEDLSALPKTADLPFKYNPRLPAADQDIYYLNTDTTDANGRSLRILQDFHYLSYQNYGAFIQVYSGAVKFVELTLSGRFDYNTRFGKVFNPRLGIVLKPTEKLKVKLLYGTSFLAPCPWKAYSTFGSFEVSTSADGKVTGLRSPFFHVPNETLRPERLTSFEANTTFSPHKYFLLSGDVYLTRIRDLINIQSPQGTGNFKDVPVAYVEMAVNEGLASMYGATLQMAYKRELGKTRFSWNMAYSYTDGKIDGKPLILTAKHTWKSVLDCTYGKLSASVRLVCRSASNSAVADSSQQYLTNRAFAVLNFFGQYQFLERTRFTMTLSLRAANLTNARYYNVAGGQDSFYATPQDPLRTEAGISVKFR